MAGEISPRAPGVRNALILGRVPVGSIVAWTNHITGTPQTLPAEFVQCLGQTITDPASPMRGQALPNLGGSGGTNFLSGTTTSGSNGGGTNYSINLNATSETIWGNSTSTTSTPVSFSITTLNSSSAVTFNQNAPAWYGVLWIMRIK